MRKFRVPRSIQSSYFPLRLSHFFSHGYNTRAEDSLDDQETLPSFDNRGGEAYCLVQFWVVRDDAARLARIIVSGDEDRHVVRMFTAERCQVKNLFSILISDVKNL